MNSTQYSMLFRLAVLLVIALPSQGQRPPNEQGSPHIGYVFPAGGQRGTTFQVVVGGKYLDGVSSAYVSGSGVQVTLKTHTRPLAQYEHRSLMNKMKALEEQRTAAVGTGGRRGPGAPAATTSAGWTAAQEKWLGEIRARVANSPISGRLPNPTLGELVTLQVTLASDAELGERELRLGTPGGLSNPLKFFVGELPEISEKPHEIVRGASSEASKAAAAKEMRIAVPSTVNGQILQGGINRYRFPARSGQQLVVAVQARELIPYISDAVPGWFQATVTLFDSKGQEVAYTDDYKFHPDPVLFYNVPASGDYVLEIKDSLYRGRDDFVYRIAIGELPFVTGVFPLGGKLGTQTTLSVAGRNLSFNQLPLDLRNMLPGIQPISTGRLSNRVVVFADTLPECFDKEPNNAAESAQPVVLPIVINGRIDQPGDMDVFRFEGKVGDSIVAEVYGRRLDSPIDSMLTITDAAGKQLAFNDDHEDKGSGLNTHHADSYLALTLPVTGSYFVHIGDTQHEGSPATSYRLRISAPRPDFELRVTPSSLNIHGGDSIPLTIHALRKDGFTGAITLRLKDAPKGFTLSSAQIAEKQDQGKLTLNAPSLSTMDPFSLHIEGYASIQGRDIVRPAVPAEDMMQAFGYRHLVPAQDLKVALAQRGPVRNVERILSATPIKIPVGGTARVLVWVPTTMLLAGATLELSEPPKGITLTDTQPIREGTEMLFQSSAAVVKPGQKGILNVKITGQKLGPQGGKAKAETNHPRGTIGALSIPFEMVAQ